MITPVLQLLFGGPKDIFKTLDDLKIEIRSQSGCKDTNGKIQDGSAQSSIPGRICLSGYRLAKKLGKADLHGQVSALILHELSHLMGADESVAKRIQKVAFDQLHSVEPRVYSFSISKYQDAFVKMSGDATWAQKHFSSPQIAHEILLQMLGGFDSLWAESGLFSAHYPVRAASYNRIEAEQGRWLAVYFYACSRNLEHRDHEICRRDYDKAFGEMKVKDAFDLKRSFRYPSPTECRNIVSVSVRKIESESDFQNELTQLSEFFTGLDREASSVHNGGFEIVNKK